MPFDSIKPDSRTNLSLAATQIFGIAIATVALGILLFSYYTQQSALVTVFENEDLGAQLSSNLVSQLIYVSTAHAISDDDLKRVTNSLNEAYTSKFIGSPAVSENDLQKNPQTLSQKLIQALTSVTENSNLILDSNFNTYYMSDALFRWLPLVLFQTNTLANDIKTHNNFATRLFCFQQFKNSLSKVKDPLTEPVPLPISFSENIDLVEFKNYAGAMLLYGSKQFLKDNQDRLSETKLKSFWSLALAILFWLCSMILATIRWRKMKSRDSANIQIIQEQKMALEKSKKLATLGEITASIAHDVANPLFIIESSAHILQQHIDVNNSAALNQISKIKRMVSRVHGITESIQSFLGNHSSTEVTIVDLSVIFEDLQLLLRSRLSQTKTELILDLSEPDLFILGSESAYVQVFVNIVNNAIDAMKNSSLKQITMTSEKHGPFLYIYVQDSGPGIAREHQERIFESFFTTKASEGGTGLGLSICHQVIHSFGGKLSYLDKGVGACFELQLPTPARPLDSTSVIH